MAGEILVALAGSQDQEDLINSSQCTTCICSVYSVYIYYCNLLYIVRYLSQTS